MAIIQNQNGIVYKIDRVRFLLIVPFLLFVTFFFVYILSFFITNSNLILAGIFSFIVMVLYLWQLFFYEIVVSLKEKKFVISPLMIGFKKKIVKIDEIKSYYLGEYPTLFANLGSAQNRLPFDARSFFINTTYAYLNLETDGQKKKMKMIWKINMQEARQLFDQIKKINNNISDGAESISYNFLSRWRSNSTILGLVVFTAMILALLGIFIYISVN